MKKWWNNVRLVEAFLNSSQQSGQQKHPLIPPDATDAIQQQQLTYDAARWYGRRKLRRELQKINHNMLHEQPESQLVKAVRDLWQG